MACRHINVVLDARHIMRAGAIILRELARGSFRRRRSHVDPKAGPHWATHARARRLPPGVGVVVGAGRTYVAVSACRRARQRANPVKRASIDRARPSGVLGPLLRPPWSLHRPLANARQRQNPPARVRASHLFPEIVFTG